MIGVIMALAAATPTVPLAPSGRWVVDYQKDMCLLSRAFGAVQSPTMFVMKPPVMMDSGAQTLYVVTPNMGGGVRRGQATLTLSPSGARKSVDYISWPTKNGKSRGYEVVADTDFAANLGESTAVSITAGRDNFTFATGKLRPVLDALHTCNEDLFKSWGVDPAAKAAALHGVSAASWFPQDSYPSDAKRRGATGRTVIVLTVSPQGRPTACRTVIAADPALDTTTCQLGMRNARFEPATTSGDRYAVLSVRWELWDD